MAKGGQFEDNTALSQARAETVRAYFVSKGIEESRLSAKGLGSTVPVEDPKDLKGAKLNAARARTAASISASSRLSSSRDHQAIIRR